MDNLNEEIERLSRIDYYPPEKRIGLALKMISDLRARLESAVLALREAERGTRGVINGAYHCGYCGRRFQDDEPHISECPFAVLSAADETITCDRCLIVATTNKDWQIMGDEHLCPDCVSQLATALGAAGERSEG